MRRLLFSSFVTLVSCFSFEANAAFKKVSDANIQGKNSNTVFTVNDDGTYTEESEFIFVPMNEKGRTELALEEISFEPDVEKLEVLFAEVKKGSTVTKIDLKTILTKDPTSDKHGIVGTKILLITFKNLDIGSEVKYKYRRTVTKPVIPGHFSTVLMPGYKRPDMLGKIIFRSKKPLSPSVMSPSPLRPIMAKEGEWFVLTMELTQPAYIDFTDDEVSPYISPQLIGYAVVSSASSWKEIVDAFLPGYESAVEAPLPDLVQPIIANARQKKTDNEKIDYVIGEVGKLLTYSGDWRTNKKMYLPQGHKVVLSQRTGDCKDFSVTTVALLRKLGIKAHVALGSSGDPSQWLARLSAEGYYSAPFISFFNHAIVRVKFPDGSVRWIDPTVGLGSYGSIPASIAGSKALILDSETTNLENLPWLVESPYTQKLELNVQARADETAKVNAQLSAQGTISNYLESLHRQSGPSSIQQFASYLAEVPKDTVANFNQPQFKDGTTNLSFSYVTKSPAQDNRKGNIVGYLPFPSGLEALRYATDERVTDLYVGYPGTSTVALKVNAPTDNLDEVDGDCTVMSSWADVKRRVSRTTTGYEVRSEVKIKKHYVTSREIKGRMFKNFLYEVGDCARNSWVILKGKPKKDRENAADYGPPIAKATLTDAIKLMQLPKSTHGYYANRKAMRILENYMQANPKDAEAIAWYALAIRDLGFDSGDYFFPEYIVEATRLAKMAYELNPRSAMVNRTLARIYISWDKLDLSVKHFNEAYALDPNSLKTLMLGGDIAEKRKDYPSARKWLEAALLKTANDEEKVSVLDSLGSLNYTAKNFPESVAAYKKAAALRPKDHWLKNNLSWALNGNSEWDEAAKYAREALLIMDFGAARANLATALVGKAESPDAQINGKLLSMEDREQLILEALKYNPDSEKTLLAAVQFYSNQLYTKNDETTLARADEYDARLLKINPENQMAKEFRLMRNRMRKPAGTEKK